MADKILKELTLKIWRQKDAKSKGEFKTYKVHNISTGTSFLEMLDILNDQVFDYRESTATPGFDRYRGSVFETAHVQLTGSYVIVRSVSTAVDEQTTSTANTFTTVMIECYRFFVLFYQLFVENIEHFQK